MDPEILDRLDQIQEQLITLTELVTGRMQRSDNTRLWEQASGLLLTPFVVSSIEEWEATYGVEWTRDAIGAAADQGKVYPAYVQAILRHWKEDGRYKEKPKVIPDEVEGGRKA